MPLYSNCNTKGALKIENAKPIDEIKELLSNTDMLLVFNDDIINEIDFDYQSISTIITFAPCLNDTAKISNIIVPIKSWLEVAGSFTNVIGDVQEFPPAVNIDEDILSEIEIIEKLSGNL